MKKQLRKSFFTEEMVKRYVNGCKETLSKNGYQRTNLLLKEVVQMLKFSRFLMTRFDGYFKNFRNQCRLERCKSKKVALEDAVNVKTIT